MGTIRNRLRTRTKALIALYAVLLPLAVSQLAIGSSKYGPTGGAGGAVSSVAGTNNVTCSPTTGSVSCSVTGTLPAARMPAFAGGDVTSSAGAVVLTIGNSAVTLAKMANIANLTILGNN